MVATATRPLAEFAVAPWQTEGSAWVVSDIPAVHLSAAHGLLSTPGTGQEREESADQFDSEGSFEMSAVPEEVWYIQGPLAAGLFLAEPLRVNLIWGAGEIVAEQPELGLHATGGDRMDALVAVAERIGRDYLQIVKKAPRLSPPMRRVHDLLARAVLEVGPSASTPRT